MLHAVCTVHLAVGSCVVSVCCVACQSQLSSCVGVFLLMGESMVCVCVRGVAG